MNWRSGLGVIPGPAKIVAVLAFVGFFFGVLGEHPSSSFGILIGLVGGGLAAAYFLLAGYIYADARLRGMPPIPWAALAVLIPNCVGFVLYFVLRKPMLHPCPDCGRGVAPDAAFCPRCGQPQMNRERQPSPETDPSNLGSHT